MKIILISDTHTNLRSIENVISQNPDADLILHTGDGANDLRRIDRKNIGFVAVKGNCDRYGCDEEEEIILNMDGIKIFMTHGHKYSAKTTKDLLLAKALKESCRICIFGHTHIVHRDERNGILMLNPGSLGYDGNYMILHTGSEISVEILKISL